MPLFSRRKSETNLQNGTSISNSADDTEARRSRGEKAVQSRNRRSKSTTRDSATLRPQRDVPPLPRLPHQGYAFGPAGGTGRPQESTRSPQRQLPPGAGPPSTQYHAFSTPAPPELPDKYPRRQSSLGPTPIPHDVPSFSSLNASTSSFASPRSHPTSPPPPETLARSSRDFDPSSHSRNTSSQVQHNPQYFFTPPRQPSRRASTNPPISSSAKLARSVSSTPNGSGFDYSFAAQNVVGIAPSSSFYGGSPSPSSTSRQSTPAVSPSASPRSSHLPHRHSSLMQRMQNSDMGSPEGRRFESPPAPQGKVLPRRPSNSGSKPIPEVPALATLPSLSPAIPPTSPPRSDSAISNRFSGIYSSPPSHSHLSLPQNRSKQSIFDKSPATSEDEGVLTEATSVDGFTPPSKQGMFELAPPLPVVENNSSPPIESFEPLPIDTTPPRSVPLPPPVPVQVDTSTVSPHSTAPSRNPVEPVFSPQQPSANGPALDRFDRENLDPRQAAPSRPIVQSPPSPVSPKSPLASRFPTSRRQESPGTPPRPRLSENRGRLSSPEGPTRAAALAAARDREKREFAARQPELRSSSDVGAKFEPDDVLSEEVTKPKESRKRPRIEVAFSLCARPILKVLLPFLDYRDLVSLQRTSRTMKHTLETDGRELILERYLGAQGYRSFAPRLDQGPAFLPSEDLVTLDLRDLSAFRASQALTLDDYSRYSRAYLAGQLPTSRIKLARATTRAWNRVVLRLRSQSTLPSSSFAPPSFPELRQVKQPVYKPPRAPQLRVWVPTSRGESWMTDQEMVECERELWRSGKGAWSSLKLGDIVLNVAIEPFGNCGRSIFDGRFLRDLSFEFDPIGHLPNWLNMLTLSPSYFHNILASSTSNPVFYLSLSPFVQRLQETLHLESEKVSLASPQGAYTIKKHVYRGMIELRAGHVLESTDKSGGFQVCHPEWEGKVVFETEGTTEHASLLIARVASRAPTPWRILREKCRPGRIFVQPVLEK